MRLEMNIKKRKGLLLIINYVLLSISFVVAVPVYADTLNVAVASNFVHTLKVLAKDFNKQSGHELRISSASTGKLFTQIQYGAPFDVFLAADTKRPDLLLSENKAEPGSAYVYAKGQLVFISNITPINACQNILTSPELKHLSIANPKTAPYGMAAKQVMEKLSLWSELQSHLVMGENVSQALQFVSSKNAEAGFVAKSMLNMGHVIDYACIWNVPSEMYSPIKQKMVLLNRAKDNIAGQAFIRYMRSARAKQIIKASGYDVM